VDAEALDGIDPPHAAVCVPLTQVLPLRKYPPLQEIDEVSEEYESTPLLQEAVAE
jgi:hypothetical protein